MKKLLIGLFLLFITNSLNSADFKYIFNPNIWRGQDIYNDYPSSSTYSETTGQEDFDRIGIDTDTVHGLLQIGWDYVVVEGTTSADIQDFIDIFGSYTIYALRYATYTINSQIELVSDIVIEGNNAFLKAEPWVSWSSPGHIFHLSDDNNIKINNVTLNGNSANTGQIKDLINIEGSYNIEIKGCHFEYSDQYGIKFDGSNRYHVSRCQFDDCDSSAIYAYGYRTLTPAGYTGGYESVIIGNIFKNCNDGVLTMETRGLLITGNTVRSCVYGFNCPSTCYGVSITNNIVYSCTAGINIYNTAFSIIGNYIFGCSLQSILIFKADGGIISGNTIEDSTRDAIYLGLGSQFYENGVIVNNSIIGTGNGYNDIYIANGKNNFIAGNVFSATSGSSERAIYLVAGGTNTIQSNRSTGHDTCFIQIDSGCDNNKVILNDSEDSTFLTDNANGTISFNYVDSEFNSNQQVTLSDDGRVYNDEWIPANAIRAPGSRPAAIVDHGISLAWEFDDQAVEANTERIAFNIKFPNDMDMSVAPDLNIGWSSTTTSADCNWELQFLYTKLDEDTSAGAQTTLTQAETASATAEGLVLSDFTLDTPDSDDVCIHCRLTRRSDNAADTINGDTVELHGVCLSYTKDKFGTAY